jgi:hypothetical protein
MADAVLGETAVGDVLDDAGVADQVAVLVELGLGLDVDDALAAVDEARMDVGREDGAAVHRAVRQLEEGLALVLGNHPQQGAKRRLVADAETEHAQALDRERRAVLAAPPVEAAHARQVLRAGEARLAALELDPRPRRPQQVAEAPGQQAPLGRLDEEVGRAGLVGARDRGIVVEAGQHQHRQRLEARQRAQLATGLEAVEPGHDGVEDDDVGQPVGEDADRLLAARCLGDVEALVLQRDRGQQEGDLIVVDEEDARALGEIVGGRLDAQGHVGVPEVESMGVTACSTAASSRSIASRRSGRLANASARIEPSISAQSRASETAPMLADDDFRVWTTWRIPCMSPEARASPNCAASRDADDSKARRTRSSRWLLPCGSSSRSRSRASASSTATPALIAPLPVRDGRTSGAWCRTQDRSGLVPSARWRRQPRPHSAFSAQPGRA